ncbi:MAG: hypothetical protein DRJ02_09495 [Bacteroidetes bacterium]|nr:MAG: hypothetical protein DRJ02_09495 [Bacteroidota bacterium]
MNKPEEHMDIIGIHGVPRSGTNWLGQLFNSHPDVNFKFQPLFSYAFKDYLNEHSSTADIKRFFEEIAASDDYFLNLRDPVIHQNYPDFNKNEAYSTLVFKQIRYHHLIENMLSKNPVVKFVFTIRNPLAVMNSWIHTAMEFKPDWSLDEEWRNAEKKNQNRIEEYFGYNKWKEAVNIFLDLNIKYPKRTKIVIYNDLLLNTELTVNELFTFSGLSFDDQTRKFIKESKKRNDADPNSVYKKKTNDDAWKRNIPEHIIEAVYEDLANDRLRVYLEQ